MIDRGANPFVVSYSGTTRFSNNYYGEAKHKKDLGYLSNLPSQKSVYFTVRPLDGEFAGKTSFSDPWFYQTGVFGKFDSVIGHGASGIVVSPSLTR